MRDLVIRLALGEPAGFTPAPATHRPRVFDYRVITTSPSAGRRAGDLAPPCGSCGQSAPQRVERPTRHG